MGLLSRPERYGRYLMIGICSFPLAASFWLAEGKPLGAFICPIRHWLGVICPGCGLTRSFVSLAHGHWERSFAYHAFGPLLFVAMAIAVVQCWAELRCDRPLRFFYSSWLTDRRWQVGMVTSFLVYYLLRLGRWWPADLL
jgi:Protein of unknown function (DUF2752)